MFRALCILKTDAGVSPFGGKRCSKPFVAAPGRAAPAPVDEGPIGRLGEGRLDSERDDACACLTGRRFSGCAFG
jgi:hypothetical protein